MSATDLLCQECKIKAERGEDEFCPTCQDKTEKARHILTHPGMVKRSIDIFNNLCPSCKRQCLRHPDWPMERYCEKCQNMMRKKWDQ